MRTQGVLPPFLKLQGGKLVTDLDAVDEAASIKTNDGYSIDHEGNPNYGTIFFLRQVHSSIDRNVERLELIGTYQLAILRELFRLHDEENIKFVFDEGCEIEVPNLETLKYYCQLFPEEKKYLTFKNFLNANDCYGDDAYKEIYDAFGQGKRIRPTKKQLRVLGNYGASPVAAFLNRSFTICKTSPENGFQSRLALLGLAMGYDGMIQLMAIKDKAIKDEMRNFFKQHQGGNAALVLGIAHDFKAVCNRRFNPRVQSKIFRPDIIRELERTRPF